MSEGEHITFLTQIYVDESEKVKTRVKTKLLTVLYLGYFDDWNDKIFRHGCDLVYVNLSTWLFTCISWHRHFIGGLI